jgi:signal transduction histidine kinase
MAGDPVPPPPLPADPSPELEARRGFSRITPRDLDLLRGLRRPLEARVDGIVEAFYLHLLGFEPTRAVLVREETVDRLLALQRRYLLSLTEGKLGARYLQDRLRIGRSHERIGLQPQWYLGAYCVLLEQMVPVIHEAYGGDRDVEASALAALVKLMNLDAQIVLDAYFEARQQRAVARSEHLAAVGELAASIAHEVRNPLAGMRGALEMLRRSPPGSDGRLEVMDEVVAQIDRLERLVRDLLTFARPNPMSRQPVQLEALLERALRLSQDGDELRGIQVERRYDVSAPPVSGDAQQLEQVLLNLIHNAAHSMEGSGTLTLSVEAGAGSVIVGVRDTGKGMTPEILRQIFQPFFTTKHRGSGLGLPIVRKIVEAHDGSVRVESEPGVGTTVLVTLPRGEVQ